MTDIVDRLRDDTKYCQCSFMDIYKPIEMEAADEIEQLRKRVELLEGYLSGALNVVEGFVHCDTKEARKALEGE